MVISLWISVPFWIQMSLWGHTTNWYNYTTRQLHNRLIQLHNQRWIQPGKWR